MYPPPPHHLVAQCRAKSVADGKSYAAKKIQKSSLTDQQAIDDVIREVQILKVLKGRPNNVEFFGAFETSKEVIMVLECAQPALSPLSFLPSEAACCMTKCLCRINKADLVPSKLHGRLAHMRVASKLPCMSLSPTTAQDVSNALGQLLAVMRKVAMQAVRGWRAFQAPAKQGQVLGA